MEEKMHLLNMPEIKELSIPEKILFVEDLSHIFLQNLCVF